MASDPPNATRVIAAYLDDVDLDLDAARRLAADPPNRLAAFHLQQAAEKLVKAVRLARRLHITADHSIARAFRGAAARRRLAQQARSPRAAVGLCDRVSLSVDVW
jgi:HEPN domain-containing protein